MGHIRNFALAGSAMVAALSAPLMAGDVPLYEAPPEWVDVKQLGAEELKTSSPIVLLEKQVRLEDGRVWAYSDMALKLSSPQMLTQMGTLSSSWLPDKGDLIIHRAELIRGDEIIDLLAGDRKFEVLRREAKLEQRVLDGMLTATMPLSGARIDDVLRLSISVTKSDQALGEEMQWIDLLLAEPAPMGAGSMVVSWPAGEDMRYALRGVTEQPPLKREGGYDVLRIDLPIPEAEEMPSDAPMRYRMGGLVMVSSFADYAEVASVMAPYYRTEDTIEPGSALAGEVATIAAASEDPLTRAALATRLVQDKVSYLMNGLDGGNYLPQSPATTWEERYGDCKAKSYLLLAMLRELGIEADAVLVRTSAGDAVPEMLPLPGAFDHIIVRATIDGTNYWLDGTSTGTRLSNIDEVPRFFYALPVVAEGAALVELDTRFQKTPDRIVKLTLDSSAGVAVPALFDIEIRQIGTMAAGLQNVADNLQEELAEEHVASLVTDVIGDMQMTDFSVAFDDEEGLATITASGIMTTPWTAERGVYRLSPPAQSAADFSLGGDRARRSWREIPLRMNGPAYFASQTEVILPDSGEGYALRNGEDIDTRIAGVELVSKATLAGDRLTLVQRNRSSAAELAAADIADAKRATTRHARSLPQLIAPADTRRAWNYASDRSALARIEAAYAKLIADADEGDSQPYLNRAAFRAGTYDFAGALEDYDAAIAIDSSPYTLFDRGAVHTLLGNKEAALADYETAEEIDPDGASYPARIDLLGKLGRTDEALALAEEYADYVDAPHEADFRLAIAMSWAGEVDEALEKLDDVLASRPGDGSILNEICWMAGIWNRMNEARLAQCVEAVEKSDNSPAALDSRALAHLRMGNYEAALADADAALGEYRALPEARYIRGLVLIAQGAKAQGKDAIAEAVYMRPGIVADYSLWGLKP